MAAREGTVDSVEYKKAMLNILLRDRFNKRDEVRESILLGRRSTGHVPQQDTKMLCAVFLMYTSTNQQLYYVYQSTVNQVMARVRYCGSGETKKQTRLAIFSRPLSV